MSQSSARRRISRAAFFENAKGNAAATTHCDEPTHTIPSKS
jgi:hypothetical protein